MPELLRDRLLPLASGGGSDNGVPSGVMAGCLLPKGCLREVFSVRLTDFLAETGPGYFVVAIFAGVDSSGSLLYSKSAPFTRFNASFLPSIYIIFFLSVLRRHLLPFRRGQAQKTVWRGSHYFFARDNLCHIVAGR